jgi:hypothetical protein
MPVRSRLTRSALAILLAAAVVMPGSMAQAQEPDAPAPPVEQTPEETGPAYENKGLGQVRRPDPDAAAREEARAGAAKLPPLGPGDTVICLAGCDGAAGSVVYRRPNT